MAIAQPAVTHTALPGGVSMTTLEGAGDGPTVALVGGVHGDEDEGVLAVRTVLGRLMDSELCGRIRAAAPAHPDAWAAHSRIGPLDGGNLARSFPGGPDTPTGVVAAGLTSHLIEGADVLIDLHSAGVAYRMPLFAGFIGTGDCADKSQEAAEAFGAPLVWDHSEVPPGRTLSVASERGIPAIYAECSGGGGIRARELQAYVRGVLSVIAKLGGLPADYLWKPDERVRRVYGGGDLDFGGQSHHHGFFVTDAEAGAEYRAGAELGRIYSYEGRLVEVVRTPRTGVVMFLRRWARIREGDVLFALASPYEEDV